MAFQRGTVLVVEEDAEWLDLLRQALRYWGMEAWFAGTYEEGLRRARDVEPQVVLVALDLVEGDAGEFVGEVRRILPATSVALVTGNGTVAASARLRAAGRAEVFVKPVELAALKEWLDQELAAPPPER